LNARRLRVEFAPSPLFAIAIVTMHAVAAFCILTVTPGVPGLLLAVLLVALGIATAWSRALLKSRSSVRAIELTGSKLAIELASGESFPAEVASRRYVGRFMVTLPLRQPVRRTLLITQDMLDGDLFRLLRIWALWGRLPAVAAEQLPV
jgi:hypothetical protein